MDHEELIEKYFAKSLNNDEKSLFDQLMQTNETFREQVVYEEDVQKAIAVFMLSLAMCFGCVIFLTAIEDFPLIAIIVEVASAFGTTGMSLGITAELSLIGKIVICSLMFIGRIGMLYTLLLFVPKQTQDLGYEYPKEKIITG